MIEKMTNREAADFIGVLAGLTVKGANPKFMYAVSRTVEQFKPIAKSLQQAAQYDSERYQEYLKRRQEIFKDCSDKEDGTPNVREGEDKQITRTVPIARQGELFLRYEKLDAEFADVKEAIDKHQEAFEELLNSETEIHIHKVQWENIPTDQIDQSTLNKIFAIVAEE